MVFTHRKYGTYELQVWSTFNSLTTITKTFTLK